MFYNIKISICVLRFVFWRYNIRITKFLAGNSNSQNYAYDDVLTLKEAYNIFISRVSNWR